MKAFVTIIELIVWYLIVNYAESHNFSVWTAFLFGAFSVFIDTVVSRLIDSRKLKNEL